MNKMLMLFALATGLMGCSAHDTNIRQKSAGEPNLYQQNTMRPTARMMPAGLQSYVKQLIDEMALNMRNVDTNETLAVTTFVPVNSDLQQSSPLSLELAETFVSELHRIGMTTVDFKATDYIRITPAGDFALTRDYLELEETISATYALVGTYHVQHSGISVHARLIELASKNVLATGESTLPMEYTQYVHSSSQQGGIEYAR